MYPGMLRILTSVGYICSVLFTLKKLKKEVKMFKPEVKNFNLLDNNSRLSEINSNDINNCHAKCVCHAKVCHTNCVCHAKCFR